MLKIGQVLIGIILMCSVSAFAKEEKVGQEKWDALQTTEGQVKRDSLIKQLNSKTIKYRDRKAANSLLSLIADLRGESQKRTPDGEEKVNDGEFQSILIKKYASFIRPYLKMTIKDIRNSSLSGYKKDSYKLKGSESSDYKKRMKKSATEAVVTLRLKAFKAISIMGPNVPKNVWSSIRSSLTSSNPSSVRWAAMSTTVKLGGEQGLPIYTKALKSKDYGLS